MMTVDKVSSYTSANAIPVKIFTHPDVIDKLVNEKYIGPTHVQLCPTNRCNLACDWCSFGNRNLREEIPASDLEEMVEMFHKMGTKGVTLTGGGDPAIHPYISKLILSLKSNGMAVGLVTNGKAYQRISPEAIDALTWTRMSFDDSRKWDEKIIEQVDYLVQHGGNVDKSFSYVVAKHPINPNLRDVIQYANDYYFKHVRIVENLFTPGLTSMADVKALVKDLDTSKVIFQGKKEYNPGHPSCLISLIKPFIAADGYVYPCCGITYAFDDNQRKEPHEMRMGHWREMPEIWKNQKNFNGGDCKKCYYKEYNDVLNALKSDIVHKEFI